MVVPFRAKVQSSPFFSLQQLQQYLGVNLPPNITFQPDQSIYPLFVLFDSDITSTISFDEIIGLAFGFHKDNASVPYIQGMAQTCIVSSFFASHNLTICHVGKFHSYLQHMEKNCPPVFHHLFLATP
jgi:hypothetical protein